MSKEKIKVKKVKEKKLISAGIKGIFLGRLKIIFTKNGVYLRWKK